MNGYSLSGELGKCSVGLRALIGFGGSIDENICSTLFDEVGFTSGEFESGGFFFGVSHDDSEASLII